MIKFKILSFKDWLISLNGVFQLKVSAACTKQQSFLKFLYSKDQNLKENSANSREAREPRNLFFAACFLLFSCASVLKYQLTVWCIGNPVTTLFNSFVLQTPCHSTLKVSGIFLKRSFSANKSNSGYFVQAFSLCNKRKPPELFNVKTAIDR